MKLEKSQVLQNRKRVREREREKEKVFYYNNISK